MTHVEEGAGILEYELAGIGFVLAVVHINVKLISLENGEEGEDVSVNSCRLQRQECWSDSGSHPGDEAVTHVFWKLLIVHQLLQENAGNTERTNEQALPLVTPQTPLIHSTFIFWFF